MIPEYPTFAPITLEMRPVLHPLFQAVSNGVSEYAFANIYLFRETHHYAISQAGENNYIFTGTDADQPFFFTPFGLPERKLLDELFQRFGSMKIVPGDQAHELDLQGFRIWEDRDNFDYLYTREDLSHLPGPKFHKKKNLINVFLRNHECIGRCLLESALPQAYAILDAWRAERGEDGDYAAAREALEQMEYLQLCGGIYYVDDKPVAYVLGEENALGRNFLIHFEKATGMTEYKGLYQFINRSFASILPDKYEFINREQDLGDPGLRQAKESYHPSQFVKKYRVSV
ncbi:TPA: ABC transporter permease [Candidatus Sumerlaeota bacterium]|jgi:uncharacterized protein|nr:ABC transporter permease [Candidatus Sumerlaeota bacterium]